MGVRGLTTYVHYHQDVFLRHHHLHDSCVVIDGSGLTAQLYRSSNCFSAFGGDYDKYVKLVKSFFKSLKKCNITSYVIFDGSYEKRKLKTVCERIRSRISGGSRLDPVSQSSIQIFPILLRYAFVEALNEMKIPYTVCEFEADNEVAAMSRRLGCPVLAYDSDFFIFNVIYIPMNTLDCTPVAIEKNGQKVYALQCKIFKSQFLTQKIGVSPDMMPLLATLLGNDYVQKRVFSKFFSQLHLPKTKQKKNDAQRTIQALFKWIENETLESALTKIIGRLKKNSKEKVLAIIKKSINGYNCKECKSLKYFDVPVIETVDTVEECPLNEDIIYNENNTSVAEDSSEESSDEEEEEDSMPDWFSDYIRMKIIPHTYYNLFTLNIHFCAPQAENYDDEDACACVYTMLRYAFDILTDFSLDSFIYYSRENRSQYKKIAIGQEYAIPRPIDKKYSELPLEELHLYFEHFLKVQFPLLDLAVVDLLPSNFRVAMLAILWWISHCDVPKGHVSALLLSYIMLDVLDPKIGSFRGHHFFNRKYSSKLEELKQRPALPTDVDENSLFLNGNKVLYEDSLVACGVLLQYFELSNEVRKKPKSYDTKIMHSFAQYQCSLLHMNCLNQISNNVYEGTTYSKFFNGTFVYNMACRLENQVDPSSFVVQHIKGAHTVIMFYKSLCWVLDRCVEQLKLQFVSSGRKKRRHRRKAGAKDVDDSISFLTEEFASEVVI